MKNLIIKLIIYFGLKNKEEFIRLLAKLEYGVSACLENLSEDARNSNYFNLANLLSAHAKEENNHGKMLATLVDRKRRITACGGGRWLSFKRYGIEIANHPDTGKGTLIVNESTGLEAIFQNLDGISQRYMSLRYFLGNKKIEELPWESRLACMSVLEEGTNNFYKALSLAPVNNCIKAVAKKISEEEIQHSDYLKYSIGQFTPFVDAEMDRWRRRLFFAKLCLIIDLIKYVRQTHNKKISKNK